MVIAIITLGTKLRIKQMNELKLEKHSLESSIIPEMIKNNLDKKKIQYNVW